jgi:hypothetical protein
MILAAVWYLNCTGHQGTRADPWHMMQLRRFFRRYRLDCFADVS